MGRAVNLSGGPNQRGEVSLRDLSTFPTYAVLKPVAVVALFHGAKKNCLWT